MNVEQFPDSALRPGEKGQGQTQDKPPHQRHDSEVAERSSTLQPTARRQGHPHEASCRGCNVSR